MGTKKKRIAFIVREVLDSFQRNHMSFQCVALSYFCTMALIPMVTLIFAVSGDLGLSDKISAVLFRAIPTYPELITIILEKAEVIITSAKSGIVGLISALILLWSILWMMYQVERVFNNAWGIIKVPRNIFKRFSFYILATILLPFIILMFCSGILAYSNLLSVVGVQFHEWRIIAVFLYWSVIYGVTALTLAAMYKFIPVPRVYFRYAMKSALVAGLVFTIFQYLYLQTQVFVTRYNAVYGVIAAVPLFLMWLNFSWQIIMYGTELCYSLQKADSLV